MASSETLLDDDTNPQNAHSSGGLQEIKMVPTQSVSIRSSTPDTLRNVGTERAGAASWGTSLWLLVMPQQHSQFVGKPEEKVRPLAVEDQWQILFPPLEKTETDPFVVHKSLQSEIG